MDNDAYTIVNTAGITGPTWLCDDTAEAISIAAEHGYTIVDVTDAPDGGTYLVIQ